MFIRVAALSVLLIGSALAEDAPPVAAESIPATLEELKKLRIPELKKFLLARGKVCDGCAEKADFVELA